MKILHIKTKRGGVKRTVQIGGHGARLPYPMLRDVQRAMENRDEETTAVDVAVRFGITERAAYWIVKRDLGPAKRRHLRLLSVHRDLLDGKPMATLAAKMGVWPSTLAGQYHHWLQQIDRAYCHNVDPEAENWLPRKFGGRFTKESANAV